MSCARLGHGEAEELFRREAEGVLLVHRRDVVEPVEIPQICAIFQRDNLRRHF
jgi:hypothetical protein